MGLEQYRITEQTEKESLTFYNKSNQPIGIVNREDAIKKGLLVEGVQLWIINPETNQVLMQRRNKNKKNNPEKIDVSVSGHVKPYETPTQAILREASEEIGIVDSQILYSKMQKIAQSHIDLTKYGRHGNYIMTFFLAFLNDSLDMYTKNEEVEQLFFMDYEELKRRVRKEDSEMLIPNSDKTELIFSILDDKIKNLEKREEEQR